MSAEKYNRVLVFDVETTGLISSSNTSITNCPYITQLSFIIYDTKLKQIIKVYDTYIKLPTLINIPNKVTEITGITKEICNKKGIPIIDAFIHLYDAYMQCNYIVAHNLKFDEQMINIELERNRPEFLLYAPQCYTLFNSTYELYNDVIRYCTMTKSIDICNISSPKYPQSKKWPRLIELFSTLFKNQNIELLNLHNSLTDSLVCLKCFLKLNNIHDDIVFSLNDLR